MLSLKNDTEKIKLLILTPTLQCGGSEKYVTLLCNNIDTQKFAVTLAVLNNADPFYTITNKSVTVIDLNVKHVRNALFKIKHLAASVQPAIIFTTANHLNIFIAVFKNLFFKKFIVVARESNVVSINNKFAKFPVLYNWLCKKYYKRLDFIICQSIDMQEDLLKNYGINQGKTTVLNNPVETDILQHAAALQTERKNKRKFITVARLSHQKGIDRLVRSVAKLKQPFTYHIIGDGENEAAIKNQIAALNLRHCVFLEGRKKDPFAGHEDAALFLMGSYFEGFPNSLLEAGSRGIPVIAFEVPGGINEIIIDGENGLLVKDNDEDAFARAIEAGLMTNFNPGHIQELTQKRFALPVIIKNTEVLLQQLITHKQKHL